MGGRHGCPRESQTASGAAVLSRGDTAAGAKDVNAAAKVGVTSSGIAAGGGTHSECLGDTGGGVVTCIAVFVASSHSDCHTCKKGV